MLPAFGHLVAMCCDVNARVQHCCMNLAKQQPISCCFASVSEEDLERIGMVQNSLLNKTELNVTTTCVTNAT